MHGGRVGEEGGGTGKGRDRDGNTEASKAAASGGRRRDDQGGDGRMQLQQHGKRVRVCAGVCVCVRWGLHRLSSFMKGEGWMHGGDELAPQAKHEMSIFFHFARVECWNVEAWPVKGAMVSPHESAAPHFLSWDM